MLAQNFKTAVALHISEVLYGALLTELRMLERGEIDASHFNMQHWNEPHPECGTICCLGGWAERIAGVPTGTFKLLGEHTTVSGRLARGVERLFAPRGWPEMVATPEQAALALRSYLTTGDARWDEALAT